MNNTTDTTEFLLNQCARCPAAGRNSAWLLPLLRRIDHLRAERSRVLVAIEGGSASGKTTLAAMLTKIYDCNVFHMDDFFLQPHQRTAERLAEPGGNVDRERFLEEVLLPLTRGEMVQYRRYDCQTQAIGPAVEVPAKALNIVEGAYSMHPALADCYDLSVFLRISPELQRTRIKKRNDPAAQERFFNTWIPLEERYFAATDVPGRCEMILEVES
jgi:uridine kinase